MIRMLLLRLLVVAIPFVVYAGWRWVRIRMGHHQGRIWEQAPTLWLFVIGVALAVLSLIVPTIIIPPAPGP